MSDRTHKTFLNFLMSLVKTGGLLALTFILTPYLIKYIGAAEFGTFRVIFEMYTHLSLLEMGLLTGIISCMIPLLKENNQEELQSLFAQGVWRFWKVVLWTMVTGLVLLIFLPQITSWNNPSNKELYYAFLILLGTCIFIPTSIYKAYLESMNKGYVVHLIILLQNTLFLLLSVLFGYYGLGLKSQPFALFVAMLVSAVILKKYSGIKIDFSKKNKLVDRKINFNQKPQILNEIAGRLSWQSDQIIISLFLGPIVVTKVFFGQRVVQIIQQQLLSIGQSSWASLGAIYYQENSAELFEKRFLEINKIISIAAIILLIPVCCLNDAFINLWVGKEFIFDNKLLIYIVSLNAFLFCLFSFWGLIFTIIGKSFLITKMYWIQAILNIILSLVFTKIYGGIGPLCGTLISFILVSFVGYPVLIKNQFNIGIRKLILNTLLPLAIGVILLLIIKKLPLKFYDLTWNEFIILGLLITVSISVILCLILFSKQEKEIYLNRVLKIKQKFIK